MTDSQKPSTSYASFAKTNNVIDGTAEKMTIDGNYAFYAPEAFTAQEISYVRTFANGNNDDGKGWETIVLPFEVNSVKQGTKNISWFHSATDKRKHFWLMELTGADADVADLRLCHGLRGQQALHHLGAGRQVGRQLEPRQ